MGAADRYEGFAEFVRARGQALSRTAYLLTSDHHAAEDLLQNALAKAALRWPALRASNPEAYVRQIIYHEHISAWRRRGRRPHELLVPAGHEQVVVDDSEGAAVRLVVARALALLTTRQRAVLVLRFFEDLTEAQTAQALGVRLGTVKSQTRDALARLRAVAPELSSLLGSASRVESR